MDLCYDYHKREPHKSWLMKHCEVLLEEANKYSNASLELYATLEARNLLEKTEFDLILMSTDKSEWQDLVNMAKGKHGLTKSNNKFKALKYRYQTFSEAIVKIIFDFELKVYDYKTSENLQTELSEYLHTYTRIPEEMVFKSDFIQNGISLVNKALEFAKSYYVKKDDGYVFGLLNFSTLNGSMKNEFEYWKQDVSEDTDGLYQRLKDINDKENGGTKAKPI